MSNDLSRRNFLELSGGAIASLGLGGEAAAQLESEDADEFQHHALLLGPAEARPKPNGEYISQWDTYRFVYFATDTGAKSHLSTDDTAWSTIPVSLEKYETTFGFPAIRNSTNRLDVPAQYDFNTGRHRLVVNGTEIQDLANTSKFSDLAGKWQINASGGDTVEFGVREQTRYVPNYELLWGAVAWLTSQDTLSTGQTLFIEFTDDERNNGYRYKFTPTGHRVVQLSGGSEVDSVSEAEWDNQPFGDTLAIGDPFIARTYLSWYGAGSARYTISYPGADSKMQNTTLARTNNQDDIATQQINNRIRVVADLSTGASSLDVDIGSFGTLIQGQATQFDREKIGTHWDLGGSISQYFTENDPVLALRIDPTRANTGVQLPIPVFAPNSETMEMLVGGVLPADTDANFLDPDDDGTNESFAPVTAPQTQSQNSLVQYTRSVSTFPTKSGVRADGTQGQVPDVRQISGAVSVGSGNKNKPPVSSADGARVKRTLYPGEIALFIPRADPASSTTTGSINFIQAFTEQDW